MDKTSSIHIRIEPAVKKKVEKILDSLGMTTAEAINIYLRQIILNSGIPFEIKNPKFNEETLKAIDEAEKIEKNPEKYKSYNTVEKFMEDLHEELQDLKD